MQSTGLATAGARIRALRVAQGLTQGALAQRVFATQAAVSQWEKDKRFPNRQAQALLADALNTSRLFLFGEEAA